SLKGLHFCLVTPPITVSTPEAYRSVKPQTPPVSLKEIIRLPVEEWKNYMTNDFEPRLFARRPAIAAIKQRLYDMGAIYASLSGSGSSVFALFAERPPHPLSADFPNYFTYTTLLTH
ncbi:MAG: 4-(cytidine 5'-diphospho)-2-C-methyl-D-erythritol kinase, partial [Prevotellaceae bacterium]|nr:4-(cytidine 5'-diphospho)-2-C-methyl-D-erythritol kinase [Prevotellaceae bacterium]